MVTSTLEFNNSVCLNPGKTADTVLQDFLTHFDGGRTSDVAQIQRGSSLFFGIADPKVRSSHGIPDSINNIVIPHYQGSQPAIHTSISVHALNGSQLTNLRIVRQPQ